jgi:RimJ/RimL family protein N-acetyltransferase
MLQARFPDVLTTDRLLLRCYGREDSAGILKLVNGNRDLLVKEFAQLSSLRTIEDAASFVSEKHEQWNAGKTFCYGVWRSDEPEQIGQIQVKNILWEIPSAELGYFIGGPWQRCGYATESIRAILRFAFGQLSFERVFVRILPENRESLSLAQKLGFRLEGLHRHAFRCGFGELHDVNYLALIHDDYTKIERSSASS